MLIRSFRW